MVGLREGSWLSVKNDIITLKGKLSARLFEKDKEAYEINSGTEIAF